MRYNRAIRNKNNREERGEGEGIRKNGWVVVLVEMNKQGKHEKRKDKRKEKKKDT